MIVLFFKHWQLLVLDILLKGKKHNQDSLLNDILRRLKAEKTQMSRRQGASPRGKHG
jgi:hypothetical protein